MTVTDSSTLRALIAAYESSVLFEEALPSALRLAKLFPKMHWSNGGLVLLGVDREGEVAGINAEELDEVYEKFEHLCAELTGARVEMGTLHVEGRLVVFLVFNTIPQHTGPLAYFGGVIERDTTI